MASQLIWWLALQRVFCNQPLLAKQLLDEFGTPSEVFRASPQKSLKTFGDWERCEKDLAFCQKEKILVITLFDSTYPKLLKEIADPPLVLMVKGDEGVLNTTCVAVVGARKATAHAKGIAFEIARGLAAEGISVVSGMAYGIDAAAHTGAMEGGKTIAVWGAGIDRCYPAVFADLGRRITVCGCVVSEFPLCTPPNRQNFPQRNRVISGLSRGVVIVEAAEKSGSLITARCALNQGREVFAVPGQAKTIMSCGTHMLLRNGATFAESAEDIITVLAPQIAEG